MWSFETHFYKVNMPSGHPPDQEVHRMRAPEAPSSPLLVPTLPHPLA